METIGPYKVLSSVAGARRPMFLVEGQQGARLLVKTAPLAGLKPEERERFEREAAICSTLDHPNLVRVVDSGQTEEFLYQVMPYLEGMDLSKIFGSGREFTWDGKLKVMDGICEGLAYAHARKLVHRDIKPANLFLEKTGRVRILDFGMVRMQASELTRPGAAVGTLNYMAPEQIRGEACTPATDVFAAGIVFHQLCTGAHPFGGARKSLPEILSAILFDAPPAWTVEGAPEGLEFVVRRALEKEPSKRWQSAAELQQALALCRFTMENRPDPAAAPPPPPRPRQATDPERTVVIQRDRVAPAPIPPRPAPAPPKPAPPKPAPKPASRYCPACAHPNPMDATGCTRCGTPFQAASISKVFSEERSRMVWWAVAGTALLLAIVVILALVTR